MNENHLLHMLANPKKFKKTENKSDYDSDSSNNSDSNNNQSISVNNYNFDNNPLCNIEQTKTTYSAELKLLLENLDNIDDYLLNNQYNSDFEIIQNYLIDLLFLIKSKK